MTLSVTGDNITFPDASTQNTAAKVGMVNRIINGAMVIDQRNAGASVTPNNTAYTLDRWQYWGQGASKFTFQQVSTAPAGFNSSLKATVISPVTVATADYYFLSQAIEGFNIADFGFGAASPKSVTLSFWVQCSLTGTFGGSLENGANNRSYPFTYTISSANTWEQKTVTITGDTTGTWLTTNGAGVYVNFGLGLGSIYSGTAGAWASADYRSATGAVSVVGTSGATFYITGVQLEKGSTATAYDFRDYGRELIMCQRYSFVVDSGTGVAGAANTATSAVQRFVLPVSMRAAPTATINTTGSWGITDDYFSGYTSPSLGINSGDSTTDLAKLVVTGFTGLNIGRLYSGYIGFTGKILLSAEL